MAQEWPAKPIRIVAPFPAGGSADILGRLLGAHFTEQFKQSVVIENRAGAGGAIGAALAAFAVLRGRIRGSVAAVLWLAFAIARWSMELSLDEQSNLIFWFVIDVGIHGAPFCLYVT